MMSKYIETPVSNLPNQQRLVTGHNNEGKAIVQTENNFQWQSLDEGKTAYSVVYTTSEFPADLNDDADLKKYSSTLESNLGLVNPGGTVLRFVDFAPGYRCGMHRTQSLDYGIVLEGNIDMLLDSGDIRHMKRGDVAVQRATQHQWVNTSETEWARMIFVLQDCKPLYLQGKKLGEDLGNDFPFLPPSGNS
ncbi:hypothetical protein F5884DRAFT_513939 [Xylogone sp. PMI_703]|nr:hypothetical protein F5884DRAFT_513939 [Xylogone sp. PMI_703]